MCTTVVVSNQGTILPFTKARCRELVLAVYKAIAAGNRANAAEQIAEQILEDVAASIVDSFLHNSSEAPNLLHVAGLPGQDILTATSNLQGFVGAYPGHDSTLRGIADEVRSKRLLVEPYSIEGYQSLLENLCHTAGEGENPSGMVLRTMEEDPPAKLRGAY